MDTITEQVPDFFRSIFSEGNITLQLIETFAVIAFFWLLRNVLVRFLSNRVQDTAERYRWRKNLGTILTFLTFVFIIQIWFDGIGSLATFFGLLSAGLAIALRDPVSDFAGWLFLITQRTFTVGDRIQVGDVRGDVIDIRMLKFTLLEIGNWVEADQSTGRVIHIPNQRVFRENIFNYTSDFEFVWNEIAVVVTFESDWKKAKALLQEVADTLMADFKPTAEKELRRASNSYLIRFTHLTPIVYTDVIDFGIRLTVRYLSAPRKRRKMAEDFWEEILDRFNADPTLDFAYPTTRFYTLNEAPPEFMSASSKKAASEGASSSVNGGQGSKNPS